MFRCLWRYVLALVIDIVHEYGLPGEILFDGTFFARQSTLFGKRRHTRLHCAAARQVLRQLLRSHILDALGFREPFLDAADLHFGRLALVLHVVNVY